MSRANCEDAGIGFGLLSEATNSQCLSSGEQLSEQEYCDRISFGTIGN